jgi:hypothetical protein
MNLSALRDLIFGSRSESGSPSEPPPDRAARPRPAFRPAVEALEDRLAPSHVFPFGQKGFGEGIPVSGGGL